MNGKKTSCQSILELTSTKLKGAISSKSSSTEVENFFSENNFNTTQKNLVTSLFAETKSNKFTVTIKQVK